jgi:predicted Zn-dependent protease
MVETLAARVKLANGQITQALIIYRTALNIYPQHRALIHGYASALLRNKKATEALNFLNQQLKYTYDDTRLYQLQARSYAALGQNMLQHHAQAEVYIRRGQFTNAIKQLQIALRHRNNNFYQISSVEARLNQIEKIVADEED